MTTVVDRLKEFVAYVSMLDGDEKGEAQVFCDRLFKAFGHQGYKEAGATLERRLKKADAGGTSFADLVWPGKVLIEMKKRGTKLSEQYKQAFDYWINAVPNRPRYVVLCNFDEFWIYDFDKQVYQPVDYLKVTDLPVRYAPLNFLFPENPRPVFGNDRVDVTREAADQLVTVFNSLVKRGEDRLRAQGFILQTLVALFSEDMDLLPNGLVASLLDDMRSGVSVYDALGALFMQMNNPNQTGGGRFGGVRYFNGGLFSTVHPCELDRDELYLLSQAATQKWSKVNPAIFGTIFQHSMGVEARHALGAHFTSEADILRVVQPTIVRPWEERIADTKKLGELVKCRKDLVAYRILDPACGSGNFLYVAYRELVRLEVAIIKEIEQRFSLKALQKHVHTIPTVSPKQCFGIDINEFGVELAKVTLLLAKKLGIDEATQELEHEQEELGLYSGEALPLDNLDANVVCADALLMEKWPKAHAIIGNPPYQSKNKAQREFGRAYINRIRRAYPDMPGRADYCVYWFRRAHDELAAGKRAGLVGTNTIRENYSRHGGLDYIVSSGGTITEAVSRQVWSGDADVHVSIVNWTKGPADGPKRLFFQHGDSVDGPWEVHTVDRINAALSPNVDVTGAEVIRANKGKAYQGQTHGHDAFLVPNDEARQMLAEHPEYAEVMFPLLIGDDLLGEVRGQPTRYVIDFGDRDILQATAFGELFKRIEQHVLPERQRRADEERERNEAARAESQRAQVAWDHRNALAQWWKLYRRRGEVLAAIAKLPRYIVCARVTKRPIFDFVDASINPSDALAVFPFADDYSFGVLQSAFHWDWFVARCSTLTARFRYTSNTVFDSFPWPQAPSAAAAKRVAAEAVNLRHMRRGLLSEYGLTLRGLYQSMEQPGTHPLKVAHFALDKAVAAAYGVDMKTDRLTFLIDLNGLLAEREAVGMEVDGPGVPTGVQVSDVTQSGDRITIGGMPMELV